MGAFAQVARADSGTISFERIRSAALGVSKAYAVYLPPRYAREPQRRYPVVYLFHGIRGNEREWADSMVIAKVMDSLVARGLPEMILVMPDGDASFFVDWAAGIPLSDCMRDSGRAARDGCVARPGYGTFVARDIVRHIDVGYRTLPRRESRGVAGLSMGGRAALTMALTHAELFAAAASISGPVSPLLLTKPVFAGRDVAASFPDIETEIGRPLPNTRLRMGADTAQWWRHDPARAAQRLMTHGPRPALWIAIGTDDVYLRENRALHDGLLRIGYAHAYIEAAGSHDWPGFRDRIAPMLRWMAERLESR